MKNSILYLPIILFLAVTVLFGCQSSEKKIENAKDKVQEAKINLANSERDLLMMRLDTISNYEQFKIEAEKIIAAREKNIAEFKAILAGEKKEINAEYDKTLVVLENKNIELKKKLADYKEDGQDNWNSFKNEFNHDMEELGKAFKGLTVDNIQ